MAVRSAPIPSREAALRIVRVLREAGHVAYLAGGCVRDRLLGLEPKDHDVATDAPPERVMELFRPTQAVGEAFGVVLVREGGRSIEVATFRVESDYADGRRPSQVRFATAEEDARRRDFTINALFEDPLAPGEGRVIDFVGGRRDLEAGVIRAVGDPIERFQEDDLRMLRAVRFAARLGFDLDPATADAIRQRRGELVRISRERIGQEIGWMLTPPAQGEGDDGPAARSSDPPRAIGLLGELGLDAAVLGEPACPTGDPPIVSALLERTTCDPLPAVPLAYPTVLAAWMIDRATADGSTVEPQRVRVTLDRAVGAGARRWRDALCLSNADHDALRRALRTPGELLDWPALAVAGRKRLLAQDGVAQSWRLLQALAMASGSMSLKGAVKVIEADAPALLAQGVAPEPWITGHDLIRLGLKPGPAFKRLIDQAYDGQLDGSLPDRAAALAWLAEQAEVDDPD